MKMETQHDKNLWDAVKVLTGKFIVINAYLKKPEKFQVNNFNIFNVYLCLRDRDRV